MMPLQDRFGRTHDYLRISITDRCNLHCMYCKPGKASSLLTVDELAVIVQAAASLGIKKVRITGGEPLLREDLGEILRVIARTPGIEDVALTTNGVYLKERLPELEKAGLQKVNISLDSLKPETYRQITGGGSLLPVLEGIDTALRWGMKPVKINMVLLNEINHTEIPEFLNFAQRNPVHLRFIEYMPFHTPDPGDSWYISTEIVKEYAEAMGTPLEPVSEKKGKGPEDLFRFSGAKGFVGLIHPISRGFCAQCNRLRVTADGYLRPCLLRDQEVPLKDAVCNPEQLIRLFEQALTFKEEKHTITATGNDLSEHPRGMYRIGG